MIQSGDESEKGVKMKGLDTGRLRKESGKNPWLYDHLMRCGTTVPLASKDCRCTVGKEPQ